MTKQSRRHGTMELRSYAPGDGGISFVWVSENNPLGPTLEEPVTESDVSEWLVQEQVHGNDWKGWDIVVLWKPGQDTRYWDVRLARLVKRAAKLHRKLVMDGVVYEYHHDHGPKENVDPIYYHPRNTDFYELTDGVKVKVGHLSEILGLCFFLNHEQDFERSGHEIRMKK